MKTKKVFNSVEKGSSYGSSYDNTFNNAVVTQT